MAGVWAADPNAPQSKRLPFRIKGTVVHGYARGGKELGFPTANFNPEAFKDILEEADVGVYYGWARLNDDGIEPMVMSIGNNPQYGNKEKSAEVHILKKYTEDFYGAKLAVVVVGFVRDMLKFTSLQQLIDAMNMDVSYSKEQLETEYAQTLKKDPFLTS
eukprot:TRINITY_DN12029_c0_g1_i1.p1 TRINITY_DN12029_c0_g1~~TRINITY_DN12029_c0_g1_i1.p1  ORF type:complete len:160 (+),score=33.33 TRINITY_DN12029_c0_g1_i1:89-568(+)